MYKSVSTMSLISQQNIFIFLKKDTMLVNVKKSNDLGNVSF